MRIIKNNEGIFAVIAGEMLNIETSTMHFIDGKPLKVGEEISMDTYKGYPKIIDGNVVNIVRAAFGYIYVPVGTNLDEFEEELVLALENLEEQMINPEGKDPEVLRQFHTVRAGYNTNVKIRSSQRLTHRSSHAHAKAQRRQNPGATNVIRQFIQNPDGDLRRGRFTWCVMPINQFVFDINSDNVEDAISRYACSVFFDGDDICKLGHNETTFSFSREMLKGSTNIINENIKLFKYGNPLLFELSDYWCEGDRTAAATLRNIPENKVFEIEYHSLTLKPVKIAENSEDTSTDICAKCRSVLWGDNYALAGNMKDPENTTCTAVCPICLHTSPEEKPMEGKYFRVFRMKVPRSMDEMLSSPKISAERRELMLEALKKFERKELYSNGVAIYYTMIGDNYASFDIIDNFLFTKLANHPDFANRKICSASVIS